MRESSGGCDSTERKIKTEGKLMVLYTNADQLINTKDELPQLIAGNEPNIIIITEVISKAAIRITLYVEIENFIGVQATSFF